MFISLYICCLGAVTFSQHSILCPELISVFLLLPRPLPPSLRTCLCAAPLPSYKGYSTRNINRKNGNVHYPYAGGKNNNSKNVSRVPRRPIQHEAMMSHAAQHTLGTYAACLHWSKNRRYSAMGWVHYYNNDASWNKFALIVLMIFVKERFTFRCLSLWTAFPPNKIQVI